MPVNFEVTLPKAIGLVGRAEQELRQRTTKYAELLIKEAGRLTSGRNKEITGELIREAGDVVGRRGRRAKRKTVIGAQLATYLISLAMAILGPGLWTISPAFVTGIVVVTALIATYSLFGDA